MKVTQPSNHGTWRTDTSLQKRVLKKFLAVHDHVYSIPITGSYFQTPRVKQTDTISYALPQRVFLGVGKGDSSYRYITNGTVHQSPFQTIIPHCTIFVPYPELTDQQTIETLLQYYENRHTLKIETIGVTEAGFAIQHCLPLVDKKTPIHTRSNKHFTTINEISQRIKQHCIITYQGKKYKTTNDIDFINSQGLLTAWKHGSTCAIIKSLHEYRFNTLIQSDFLHKILLLEKEINTHFDTENEIVLMINKKHICLLNFSETVITQENRTVFTMEYDGGTLLYNSITQGYAKEGYRCEQRLSKGITHELSPKIITVKTSRSGTHLIEGSYEEIKESADILLDGISNKVTINGHTYDSTQLPSQKATIEILGKLIETYGESTKNTDFPVSSYVKNKNTLVGKIIAPLNKLLKNNEKSVIKRSVEGSLYSFDLMLPKQHIDITYIKKLY